MALRARSCMVAFLRILCYDARVRRRRVRPASEPDEKLGMVTSYRGSGYSFPAQTPGDLCGMI